MHITPWVQTSQWYIGCRPANAGPGFLTRTWLHPALGPVDMPSSLFITSIEVSPNTELSIAVMLKAYCCRGGQGSSCRFGESKSNSSCSKAKRPATTKSAAFGGLKKAAIGAVTDVRDLRSEWESDGTQKLLSRTKESFERDGDLTRAAEVQAWGWKKEGEGEGDVKEEEVRVKMER